MKDNPSKEVCIPMEFQDAYEKFPCLELCKCSMSLFYATPRNHGGQYFSLKSVLGDVMLLDKDCDEIFCILSDLTTNHNLSMRKWILTEESLEEKQTLFDKNKKVEAMNIVGNAATKLCQRSIASSNKKENNSVEDKKEDNVIDNRKEKKWVTTRRYSLCRSIAVHKDNVKFTSTTTNGNIEVMQSPPNATTSTNMNSTSDVQNNTESEKEKEKEGMNWIVKVHLDSDIKIIGEAFVSSPAMGVEWQQLVNDEVVAITKKL